MLAEKSQRSLLFISPSERLAELAAHDINLFTKLPVIHYPGYDIPPYTPLSPDQTTVADRLNTLYRLFTDNQPVIIVASCESLLRRVIPKSTLGSLAELIINGEETEQEKLIHRLAELGYEHLSLVQATGDFSVRGGIADIFPPGYDAPLRLDFFGDTVDVREGSVITLDANDGYIYRGKLPVQASAENDPEYLEAEKAILEIYGKAEEYSLAPSGLE